MPMKSPPHSGDFIFTEIIAPAGLSVTAAAAALQVSRPALSSLLPPLLHKPPIYKDAFRISLCVARQLRLRSSHYNGLATAISDHQSGSVETTFSPLP